MLIHGKKYTVANIVKLTEGYLEVGCDIQLQAGSITADSRQVTDARDTIFFALKTSRNDGHKYISELYEKGVRIFVVSNTEETFTQLPEINIIKVSDALQSLQLLCRAHRQQFDLPLVAITGSNGKTVVKEWLFQLLSPYKKIVRSPKSYNSQLGVPLSVWQINDTDTLGIFEAGISQKGEMQKLEWILNPTFGIFTNIGEAHNENFKSRKEKIDEKLKLFIHVNTLIYCSDYKEIDEAVTKTFLHKKINLFTWGTKGKPEFLITEKLKSEGSTLIKGLYKKENIEISIPFRDEASIENAINCWAFMLAQGFGCAQIKERMKLLNTVAMRLELKEGINGCTVINDSYNSDINSLTIALDFLKQQDRHEKRTLILSDILQSGLEDAVLYEKIAHLIKDKEIHRIIGIGKAISSQKKLFEVEKIFFIDTAAFIRSGIHNSFRNEAILLKGAREFEFENIMLLIQQKTHSSTLEVNLNAIVHNLNYYKNLLQPKVKMMVMVKAFSYGTGSYEIANLLQYHQVDYLGVAFSDEGKELRKAGITLPVMVMNPEAQSFDDMISYGLEPEIYNIRILKLFLNALEKNNQKTPYPVHIKIDTGMHRLGFEEKEITELCTILNQNKILKVKSVFSHLSSSGNAQDDAFTMKQIALFEKICFLISKSTSQTFLRHILNSSGITRFPEKQYDMVRLGLGLYGISPFDDEQKNLQYVSTLRTTISQLKDIEAGESIGYDRRFTAPKPMRIATVPIGYADGLNRLLGNGKGLMRINDTYVPIIGNICMDMCMLDVTGVEVSEGDDVIVFDKQYSIKTFAKITGTIPYEVLTGFSRRVKRVYYHE